MILTDKDIAGFCLCRKIQTSVSGSTGSSLSMDTRLVFIRVFILNWFTIGAAEGNGEI